MTVLTGHGTLYDADENELGAVAYRIEHDAPPGEPILTWAGELNLEPDVPDVPLDPGRYVLELDDGSRGDVELEPAGASSGAEGQIAFTGIGVFGTPIVDA
jgi:hypothetical protein